jgi:hypothetical protein
VEIGLEDPPQKVFFFFFFVCALDRKNKQTNEHVRRLSAGVFLFTLGSLSTPWIGRFLAVEVENEPKGQEKLQRKDPKEKKEKN